MENCLYNGIGASPPPYHPEEDKRYFVLALPVFLSLPSPPTPPKRAKGILCELSQCLYNAVNEKTAKDDKYSSTLFLKKKKYMDFKLAHF